MRGIRRVHRHFPVAHVWCSGVTGSSPDCAEYDEYMTLRRDVGYRDLLRRKYWDKGNTRLRVMNSKNDDLRNNPNAQSIVIKVEHRNVGTEQVLSSVMLTGDTDAATWKNIQSHYSDTDLSCSILLASHHGSLTFFDDPSETRHYYTNHIRAMAPAMTVISVGPNSHGHPDKKAIELYETYSRGSNKGNKIKRTDEHGSIIVELKDDGKWLLNND
jgi:beta-lactamase superfamily II metal-dependent hydrolase